MSHDFRRALRIVWLVVTFLTAGAVAAPFAFSEETISRVTPTCQSRNAGTACWMCGTTTGFIAIAHGDWASATAANPLALPLFAAFAVNAAIATFYLIRR